MVSAAKLYSFLFLCGVCCSSVYSTWVDPDSPPEAQQLISFHDARTHTLVASDEFNYPGRIFKDGYDPMWTSEEHSDDSQTSSGLMSLQYYNSSYATTSNGFMNISTTSEQSRWRGWNPYKKRYTKLEKHFRSGMVTSWNKFCFTGGILEVSLRLPGESHISGLWPAVWLLGNLGRATYEASTNLMWPWSYDRCERAKQQAQELSACNVAQHFDMHPFKGRGATEIDILETMGGTSEKLPGTFVTKPYAAMTLQIAPGVPKDRPAEGFKPFPNSVWYRNMHYGNGTDLNPFFYGTLLGKTKAQEPVGRTEKQEYQADAVSAFKTLRPEHWNTFRKYRLEWQTHTHRTSDGPTGGYLRWYIDDEMVYGIDQSSLDFMKSQIPNEPSYIIMNTAISSSWGFPLPCPRGCECDCYSCHDENCMCGLPIGFCESLPAHFLIDWVRVYQDKNDTTQTIGCNPQARPTRKFIEAHAYRYKHQSDHKPLVKVNRGGKRCHSSGTCGMGHCYARHCRCDEGWTGPNCKSREKKNDFKDFDDVGDYVVVENIYLPPFLILALVLLAGSLVSAVAAVMLTRSHTQVHYARL